jgi:hypothetical protein
MTPQHHQYCKVWRGPLPLDSSLCSCGLAALEAKAAKWDAAIEQGSVIVKATDYLAMQADAAKWRLVKETARRVWNAGGEEELHIVVMGDSTLHLIPCENEADAVRYRKIKAAVEAGERFTAFQDKYGAVARVGVAGLGMPYASGPTLDEAVDQLPEAT